MKPVAGISFVLLVAALSSQMQPAAALPAGEDAAALIVYLQPLSPDAARLTFTLTGMAATRDDGSTIPLQLSITELRGEALALERRLAAGELPPGRYTGLSFTVGVASLLGDEGVAELRPPAGPVEIDVPFKVGRRRAVVLSLKFDYRASVGSGFRFTPTFSATAPPRPAPDLIGLASNRGSSTVTLFDKVSGRVVGVVPTGHTPAGLALDPDRHRAYVAASGEDAVESIDLLEQAVLARLNLRGGDRPVDVAVTPDGRTLLTANSGSSTVSLIDAISLVEIERIAVGEKPEFILVDRVGRRAYVFNTASGTISVINIVSRVVLQTIPTEAGPFRGEFNRDGDRLFVIHLSSPHLTVISLGKPLLDNPIISLGNDSLDDPMIEIEARIYIGPGATAVEVDRRTNRVYVADRRTQSVEIYDPFSLLPVDSFPIDSEISFMTIDVEGNNLYLVLSDSNEIRVLRMVGKETVARVEIGRDPYDVALSGER